MAKPITPEEMTAYVEATWNKCQEEAWQEQEPVAWADKVGAVIPHSHKLFQPDLLKDYTRPLYTAPPKREWASLTGYQRLKFADRFHISGEAIEAIEQALKEKNQ